MCRCHTHGSCHGCRHAVDRRRFLRDFATAAAGATAGAISLSTLSADAAEGPPPATGQKRGAVVRAAFIYPPSKTFADNPNGWWSWPGNDFDAEGRQKQYTAAFREIEKRLGIRIVAHQRPVAGNADVERLAKELEAKRPDGLLLVMFYNRSLGQADEQADGLTMNCLRRGMLKPCVSFSALNSELIPAACENDFPAMYTQLMGQLLTGRPGFQHNPCYETERNHYYGSHCTCPTKVYGPDGPDLPYLLRRFAHTNEGSCAIQVFWKEGDPVTMVRYYPGNPPALDVYAGKVFKSHPMPPAAGCTTNVEIEIADRPDACMVRGHHNLIFCGDFAREFRLFAQLFKMKLADTDFQGPWPI